MYSIKVLWIAAYEEHIEYAYHKVRYFFVYGDGRGLPPIIFLIQRNFIFSSYHVRHTFMCRSCSGGSSGLVGVVKVAAVDDWWSVS